MSHFKKILFSFMLIFTCFFQTLYTETIIDAESFSYVSLSHNNVTTHIGNQFFIIALTSTGKKPTWKSSNQKVASVNTYGQVTTKHSGTALITAKIKDAEATCKVTVTKTEISLCKTVVTLEHGDTYQLSGKTSNRSSITWKSNKKSIATVSENGLITAYKPGEAVITAHADDSQTACKVIVKKPEVRLSLSATTLYRKEQRLLSAKVSSNQVPQWKSSKKSVATVDDRGLLTAVKHGSAIITATVDGVSSKCYVTVKQPTIELSHTALTLKAGQSMRIAANVSSGNSPQWSSSNTSIAKVSNGTIIGVSKGKTTISAIEDGVKAKCSVVITE